MDPLVLLVLVPRHLLLVLPVAWIASARSAWLYAAVTLMLIGAWVLPAALMVANSPTPLTDRIMELVGVAVPLCVMIASTSWLCVASRRRMPTVNINREKQ
jgi:hypothetical protein